MTTHHPQPTPKDNSKRGEERWAEALRGRTTPPDNPTSSIANKRNGWAEAPHGQTRTAKTRQERGGRRGRRSSRSAPLRAAAQQPPSLALPSLALSQLGLATSFLTRELTTTSHLTFQGEAQQKRQQDKIENHAEI